MTAQNCAFCPLLQRCQGEPAAADWRAINSLVCRLKLGIEVETATAALLVLLHPKIISTAQFIERGIAPFKVERDVIIGDLQSTIITDLLHRYRLGDRAYPLLYLFGPRGSIYGYALKYVQETRDYYSKHDYRQSDDYVDFEDYLSKLNATDTTHTLPLAYENTLAPTQPTGDFDDIVTDALNYVHDGETLTLAQYRVMAFCLRNASVTPEKPAWNLQTYLAGVSNLSRVSLARHYLTATRKLVERVGLGAKFLARRGITVKPETAERRKLWAKGQTLRHDLTAEENQQLLEFVRKGVSIVDACYAFGVSESYFRTIRRRHGKQSTGHRTHHGDDGLSTEE